MATVAEASVAQPSAPISPRPVVRAIDRWIYVYMAASFIAVTLAGFVPDSIKKIAAVNAGERPAFPLILHLHAVLMGSFLLLLLAQTTLAATGRFNLHQRLGRAAMVVVPALVVVGLMLVPTTYHYVWNAAQSAPPATRGALEQLVLHRDNVTLLQLRVGLLFPLFIILGLRARRLDAGFHKRMMILATAVPLVAGLDRIAWLPNTHPLGSDLYTLLLVSPMFIWDVARSQTVHRAYATWLSMYVAAFVVLYSLWDTPWWHSIVPRLMVV